MDNFSNNPGAPTPPVDDPGKTQYIPPVQGYQPPQGAAAPATQAGSAVPAAPVQPNGNQQAYQPAMTAPAQTYVAPPPTYQQAGMAPQPYSAAARRERNRTIWALILIGAGALFLFDQLFGFSGFGDLILVLAGGAFMYAYFTGRPGPRIGFLIPGAILLGIGLGALIQDSTLVGRWIGGEIVAVTMGLGFCTIWFFERKHWWALIPGGILILAGLSSIAFFGQLWPLLLIALGIYLLYDQTRRRSTS